MNAMMDRLTPRVKQMVRSLVLWFAPAGTWRQRVRFQLVRWVRRWRLPGKPRIVPPLPRLNDADAVACYLARFNLNPPAPDEESSSDRIFHWLDFHPHVLSVFPLATTPAELPAFVAW